MVDHLPLLRSSRELPLLSSATRGTELRLPSMLEPRLPIAARLQAIAQMISAKRTDSRLRLQEEPQPFRQ